MEEPRRKKKLFFQKPPSEGVSEGETRQSYSSSTDAVIAEPVIVTALKRSSSSERARNKRRRRMIGNYQVLAFLGRGSQGTVLKCQNVETKEIVAIKTIYGGSLRTSNVVANGRRYGRFRGRSSVLSSVSKAVSREIALLKKVDHPNIVKLLDVIDNTMDKDIHLVFEYVPGGPLRQLSDNLLLKNSGVPLLEDEARTYFRQLAAAIRYLHFHAIIHRDIKPSNVIIDRRSRTLKLTDLGIAVQTKQTKESKILGNDDDIVGTSMVIGTPAFLPPEFYKIKRSEEEMQEAYLSRNKDDVDLESGNLEPGSRQERQPGSQCFAGRAADVWAAGVTLFAFIYGCLPHMQTPRKFSGMFSKLSSSSSSTDGVVENGFRMGSQRHSSGQGPPSQSPRPTLSRLASTASSKSYKSRKEPLTLEEMENRILNNPLKFPGTGLGTSARLRHLLTRMLEKDPRKRIRIEDVCRHDWLSKYEPMPELSEEQKNPLHLTKDDQVAAISRTSKSWLVSLQRMLRRIRSKAHVFSSAVRAGDKSFKEEIKSLERQDAQRASENEDEVFEDGDVEIQGTPSNQLHDVQEEDSGHSLPRVPALHDPFPEIQSITQDNKDSDIRSPSQALVST